MRKPAPCSLLYFVAAMMSTLIVSGCGGAYEETISGMQVPVPKAMTKSTEKPVEMSILGFGAGQASFHGNMETDKLIEFYKKEMAARGWQPNLNIQSGGAMLAFTKEGKTLLVAIDKPDKETRLTLTVGGVGR
ncbi:MAG TPA: hypothetical protein VHV54_18180 [Candidatus Binatia bacterium]|nr:hypothetical protein [Candidatus Binatia bacterium]